MSALKSSALAALVLLPAALALLVVPTDPTDAAAADERAVLVIHGGAGDLPRKKLTPEVEKEYRLALEEALRAGHQALGRKNGTSLDAVEAAVRVLEDCPLFNAGKGAVFTSERRHELDASIMEGKGKRAGAVAGVTRVKNPIRAARAVMEKSKHVLFAGPGADEFARRQGLEIVDPSYFGTEERLKDLKEAQEEEKDRGGRAAPPPRYFGTVGAVAVDRDGNLAAGTSTGGMTNKRPGRVGDSPIIGAGTYADNNACAVSCTGSGEYFIRHAVAHDIVALVQYGKRSVHDAAAEAIDKVGKDGGDGGVIVLDAKGNFAMRFNTKRMYRGHVTAEGKTHVVVFK